MPDPTDILKKIGISFPDFEDRKSQRMLAEFVWRLMENGGVGVAEAPTGTGKTLAYLIPAFIHAKMSDKPVVISTNTINLQHQIIHKDIPVVRKILNADVRVALGRANYVCLSRLYLYLSREKSSIFAVSDPEMLTTIIAHPTGEKSEVMKVLDENTWEAICSTPYSCGKSKCQYFKKCFFYRARRSLESADIIVANHHIVLSDMATDSGVLPDYDTIIFDEAHNLEKNATLYFTRTISSGLINILNKLLPGTADSLIKPNDSDREAIRFVSESVEKNTPILLKIFTELMEIIPETGEIYLKDTKTVKHIIEKLLETLNNIRAAMETTKEIWEESNISNELLDISNRITETLETAEEILSPTTDETILWMKKAGNQVHINLTPTKPDTVFREKLYPKLRTMLLISATLSVGGDFTYVKNTFGLDNPTTATFESEFDYKTQCKLVILKNAPDPKSEGFVTFISKAIINTAEALTSHGGMIILFTSHSLLNKAYALTHAKLNELGLAVLKQGDEDRFEMLTKFTLTNSVLFGTNSFWEGIDVKGEKLSVVFITKLPFDVPESAIEKARYEMLKKQGGNGFMEYSLPKAVLRFKQGFGRLIRSKTDRGIIITADSRILTRFYGKFFLKSLPNVKTEVINESEIHSSLSDFFTRTP